MLSRRTAVTAAVAGLGLLVAGLPGGCADTMRNEQLACVAKDWSLVVRASQVIPVYPLTEDLMPGDVFLVRMSIPQQHREYQKRGFLPMDMHLTRLQKLDYSGFYLESYGTKGKDNTPYHWQFPPDGNAPATLAALRAAQGATGAGPQKGGDAGAGGTQGGQGATSKPQSAQHRDSTLWPTAPRAAFPSYTFQVDARGGMQVALPIQGVPVALSMMQTQKASGSVTLNDAYTYGVPFDELVHKVHAWMTEPNNAAHVETLKSIRLGVHEGNTWASVIEKAVKYIMLDHNERTVYLRVISRVYIVGSVTVALINTGQGAADAQVGAARNIELLNPAIETPKMPQASSQTARGKTDPNNTNVKAEAKKADAAPLDPKTGASTVASDFQKALEAVNANLGGAVKLRWATGRSVALDETFPRPLVIGYLAFDFPINKDGSLGTPIATQHQLEGTVKGTPPEAKLPATPEQRDRVTRWLAQDQENQHTRADLLSSWLKGRQIPIKTTAGAWVRQDALSRDLTDAMKDLDIPQDKPEKPKTPEEKPSEKPGAVTKGGSARER